MPQPRNTAATKPRKPRAKLSAHQREGVTESVEDYLECISNLTQENGFASVSDVAETLDLIRPSVSLMIKKLSKLGYLKREPYRGFVLTSEGEKIARAIQARHKLLTELFEQIGLKPDRQQDDIEGIEHHISEPTFRQLKKLVAHLKQHPMN